MVQTFSIRSNLLSKFIGTALLNAPRLALVSPWVSDIPVIFPETDQLPEGDMLLSEAVVRVDCDIAIFADPDQDDHNEEAPYALLPKVRGSASIHKVENLHAKAVVTDDILYQGSANVTYRGLNINIELCDIRENEHDGVDGFLSERLGLRLESQSSGTDRTRLD